MNVKQISYMSVPGIDWVRAKRLVVNKEYSSDYILRGCKQTEIIELIMIVLAKAHGVAVQEIQSLHRGENIRLARQRVCYFARKYTDKKFETIGKFINRDHSTVLYSERIVCADAETSDNYRHEIEDINKKIIAAILEKDLAKYCKSNMKVAQRTTEDAQSTTDFKN